MCVMECNCCVGRQHVIPHLPPVTEIAREALRPEISPHTTASSIHAQQTESCTCPTDQHGSHALAVDPT